MFLKELNVNFVSDLTLLLLGIYPRELKIHGEDIQVNCDVVMLDNMSAHSDSDELMEWLSSFKQKPKKLFLVHGEKKSMEAFQERVENELNWDVEMPEYLQIRQL